MVKPFHKHKNKNIDEITSEFHQEWFHQLGQECESMNVEEWQGLEDPNQPEFISGRVDHAHCQLHTCQHCQPCMTPHAST